MKRERPDRTWVPYFVLVVALLATTLATYYAASTAESKDWLRFQNANDRISNSVSNRLETYTALLRSGGAFFSASQGVDRQSFHSYVQRLELGLHYPGVRGIGFSLRVPSDSRDSFVTAMRRQGLDSFAITPQGERQEYHAIVYLEPLDDRNRGVIGYDMFTDPIRRKAMEQARDSGHVVISGKVLLIPATGSQRPAGFLIYVPVFRGGGVPPTVEERRRDLVGYVYAPFRSDAMLSGAFNEADTAQIELQIYDGSHIDPGNLIYDSRATNHDTIAARRSELADRDSIPTPSVGRVWTLVFHARPGFYLTSSRGLVADIPILGIFVSLVLFGVTRAQARARTEAERIAAELRRSEEALRESESRLRRLVESNVIGIIISDTSGRLYEANDAFLDLIDSTRDDLVAGRINWADLTPPEYWERDREAIQILRSTGSHPPYEKAFVRSDGTLVPVLVGNAYLGGANDLGVGFILDLTEQKKTQSALRSSEVRFRTIIEQSPLAIQIFSLDGECILANTAWENLWQASREVLKGYNILKDPQLAENGMLKYIQRAFAGDSVVIPPFRYDPILSNEQGRLRWVRVFVYPLRDDTGTITEITLKAEDVTDRIEAEQQLKLAKEAAETANRAKDQFLAVLSHELRTPLTPVLTAAYVLAEYHGASEEFNTLLSIIQRNVELEARLIDDLLDLTRITNGKLQLNLTTVDAHALLRDALEICRADIEQKGLTLELNVAASEHSVLADPARLQQVFWNLIKNAVKFTPDGGGICVRTWNEEGGLRIEVSDTGIGIEQEILSRIFNAFEQGEQTITRQFGGLGLGLAISRSLVEMHGGSITAASEGKGKGAVFTVRLAVVPSAGRSVEVPSIVDGTPVQVDGADILVVEDHQDTARLLRMLLEHQGHRVRVVGTVADALDAVREQGIDLIISDIGLPDGSGYDLLPKLREFTSAPAIALSGYGMDEDIRRSLNVGYAEHLTKPVNLARMYEVVGGLLQGKVTTPQSG